MKIFMRTYLLIMAVMFLATLPAHASSENHHKHKKVGKTVTPEIDPALGVGALVFISGSIMVIRGRRKN